MINEIKQQITNNTYIHNIFLQCCSITNAQNIARINFLLWFLLYSPLSSSFQCIDFLFYSDWMNDNPSFYSSLYYYYCTIQFNSVLFFLYKHKNILFQICSLLLCVYAFFFFVFVLFSFLLENLLIRVLFVWQLVFLCYCSNSLEFILFFECAMSQWYFFT